MYNYIMRVLLNVISFPKLSRLRFLTHYILFTYFPKLFEVEIFYTIHPAYLFLKQLKLFLESELFLLTRIIIYLCIYFIFIYLFIIVFLFLSLIFLFYPVVD